MKRSLLVLFVLVPPAGFAAGTPLPAFPSEKIGVPPLSLLEGAKQGPAPISRDGVTLFRGNTPPPKGEKKVVSNMPVISPPANVTYHLRVVAPDDSVDHKMIVKTPDVESAK